MISITRKTISREKGFTIVEVMIAMAIFTVIVTIGIGAVLDTIRQHYVTQNTRTVMDSLNFVMEDMVRNIRLGTNMRCGADSLLDADGNVVALSCPSDSYAHNVLSFNDLNGNLITYTVSIPSATDGPSEIFKKKGTDAPGRVTPPEVEMDFADSGFTVRGAEPDDGVQPTVVIRLSGTIKYKDVNSKFAIQTTVTPRGLDS